VTGELGPDLFEDPLSYSLISTGSISQLPTTHTHKGEGETHMDGVYLEPSDIDKAGFEVFRETGDPTYSSIEIGSEV
jgi:hypothetical protein